MVIPEAPLLLCVSVIWGFPPNKFEFYLVFAPVHYLGPYVEGFAPNRQIQELFWCLIMECYTGFFCQA